MLRILALFGAAAFCAVMTLVPDAPSSQTSWAEGSPDLWASAKTYLASVQDPGVGYVCPMDRDVSSKTPGFCPRCGMKLVAGVPDAKEFSVRITADPAAIKPDENTQLTFRIEDPKTEQPVRSFEIVHEKLYHLFVVSQDLRFFLHTHPEPEPNGEFRLGLRVPKPGMYRVLSDFYPKGGTPQLVVNTLMVDGAGPAPAPVNLAADLAPQHAENTDVELVSDPAQPIAGRKAVLYFRVKPNDGIEPYLGAMAHLLAASSDLIDMMHSHPMQVSDHSAYKELRFQLTFPRAGTYRVWVQTQRKGVVNTVAFNVPVGQA